MTQKKKKNDRINYLSKNRFRPVTISGVRNVNGRGEPLELLLLHTRCRCTQRVIKFIIRVNHVCSPSRFHTETKYIVTYRIVRDGNVYFFGNRSEKITRRLIILIAVFLCKLRFYLFIANLPSLLKYNVIFRRSRRVYAEFSIK